MTHTSCLILIHMIQHMGILLLYLLWSPIETFKGMHPTHIHQYTHSTHNPSLFANCNVYYPMHGHLISSPNMSVYLATRDITNTTTIQMLGIITAMEIRKKAHPTHIHQCTRFAHNLSFITMCTIHTGILFQVLLCQSIWEDISQTLPFPMLVIIIAMEIFKGTHLTHTYIHQCIHPLTHNLCIITTCTIQHLPGILFQALVSHSIQDEEMSQLLLHLQISLGYNQAWNRVRLFQFL